MIIGEYLTKVGEKKRIAIPKKFRTELGNDLIVTRGYEECLIVVNKKLWNDIARDVINGSFINRNIRETSRFLVGGAVEVMPDSQGRIVLPDNLYSFAKLHKEIVFVGLINWVEIWDKEQWNKKLDYLNKNSQKIADELQGYTRKE